MAIKHVGSGEIIDQELLDRIEELEDQEAREEEARVSFRWGREQLAVVKRAAANIGVPYQTYLKQVVYKQALEDIKANNLASASK